VVLKLAGVDVASNFSLIVNVLSGYFVQNFGQIFILIMVQASFSGECPAMWRLGGI